MGIKLNVIGSQFSLCYFQHSTTFWQQLKHGWVHYLLLERTPAHIFVCKHPCKLLITFTVSLSPCCCYVKVTVEWIILTIHHFNQEEKAMSLSLLIHGLSEICSHVPLRWSLWASQLPLAAAGPFPQDLNAQWIHPRNSLIFYIPFSFLSGQPTYSVTAALFLV